jgi:hypothetical protein
VPAFYDYVKSLGGGAVEVRPFSDSKRALLLYDDDTVLDFEQVAFFTSGASILCNSAASSFNHLVEESNRPIAWRSRRNGGHEAAGALPAANDESNDLIGFWKPVNLFSLRVLVPSPQLIICRPGVQRSQRYC